MRTHEKTALVAALSLAGGLWLTPMAFAHDDYYNRSSHRYTDSYRGYYGNDWQRGERAELHHKYDKAMNRLARQEREAREKAYRKYGGDRSDPRYRERLAEIDRKYDQKRWQVERNTGKERRELSREYRDYRNDWWD
jgi:hypothetical protein